MQVIESTIDPNSPEFAENAKAMQAEIETFRGVEQLVRDKAEEAREKFNLKNKLLPRARINLLLDRGSPFLEICSLAGYKMHEDKDGSMAGGGMICGIGYVGGARCLISASNSAIKGVAPSHRQGSTRLCGPRKSPWRTACR